MFLLCVECFDVRTYVVFLMHAEFFGVGRVFWCNKSVFDLGMQCFGVGRMFWCIKRVFDVGMQCF